MAEDLVTVDMFWNVSEAHLAKSTLEEEGIEAFLENEHAVGMTPHLANPAGVQLKVKRSDHSRAAALLAEVKG